MRILRLRLFEMFLWCIGLSVVSTALTYSGFAPNTTQGVGLVMFCGFAIYIAVQTFELRRCFFVLEHKFEYFLTHIIALSILAFFVLTTRPVLNFAGGFFGVSDFGNVMHTWMFGIFKFAMFSSEETSWFISCVVGMALIVLDVILAPMGMKNYLFFNINKE